MRGRRSRDSAGARSRSNGEIVEGIEVVEVIKGTAAAAPDRFLDFLDELDDLDDRCALAESTSAI